MATKEFGYIVTATLTMEHGELPKVNDSKVTLKPFGNIDSAALIDGLGWVRKDGMKPTTDTLVMALISNIKVGHYKNWQHENDHLVYVLGLLGKAFTPDLDVKDNVD